MSANKETFGKTVGFVLAVCVACALLVSFSAVQLKPLQQANKLLDKQTKILQAAGLLEAADGNIVATYNQFVEAKMIDLDSGEFIEGNPDLFDERRNSRDVEKSEKPKNDIAGINRRSHDAVIYLVRNGAGEIDTVVFPMVGSGLWDLMYAYVGVEADLNTIKNVIYTAEMKETPGLGAEVLNPAWIALWPGKKIFDDKGQVRVELVKGGVKEGNPSEAYQVDGLSGATLTANGVTKTFKFWFGDEGYSAFIDKNRGGLN
ncbi:Na(+)-translocating NADH-quinone reductase subunit C [Thalassotalea sp. M1531]|uniref:Na(+)-translocating NADH-quinone reductase subunit C n=1 Tax=Thalassotalea algicola TaxID=2716224 RepID=A0A7Y0LEI0_9GAMM|nr:Na(+)-translocating NADH-quinone reductase subunit C [Thalassotalea algicola]NMP32191.1 Na(+)-translocating NADH-quinone reductase subunit C [Thalassotalea algicola]